MTEVGRFFDQVSYGESDQAEVQARFRTDGVIAEAANKLAVSAPGGMFVSVNSGEAMIQGFWYKNTGTSLAIAANTSGSTRVDRVVVNLNRTLNTLALAIVQGTPGAGAPALTQVAGGQWQIPIGLVTIPTGTLAITAGMLTDQRTYGTMLYRGDEIQLGAAMPALSSEPHVLRRSLTVDPATQLLYLSDPTTIRKNYLHNTAFRVNQRGTVSAVNAGDYPCDRFKMAVVAANGYASTVLNQGSSLGTLYNSEQGNVLQMLRTATTAPGSTNLESIVQIMEGIEFAQLAGMPLILSFWAYSTKAGTFSASIEQIGSNWKYVGAFTLPASVWTFCYLMVPWSASTGTWNTTTVAGAMQVRWTASAGSGELCSTSNAWVNEAGHAAAAHNNPLTTVSDALYIGAPKLETGSVAPTRWEAPDYYVDQLQCYRVLYVARDQQQIITHGANSFMVWLPLPIPLRAAPSFSSPVTPAFHNGGSPGASEVAMLINGGFAVNLTYTSWATWVVAKQMAVSLISSSTNGTGITGAMSGIFLMGTNISNVWSAEL